MLCNNPILYPLGISSLAGLITLICHSKRPPCVRDGFSLSITAPVSKKLLSRPFRVFDHAHYPVAAPGRKSWGPLVFCFASESPSIAMICGPWRMSYGLKEALHLQAY